MELVGYEDVEARSHEPLASLVVHRYEYDLKCFDIGNNVLSESNKCICPACKQDMHERLDICPYCETHIVWSDDEQC